MASPAESLDTVPVTASTCRDFIYFRRLVAKSRSYWEDNINHRLNDIDTTNSKQCRKLWSQIETIRKDRRKKLDFCLEVLRKDADENSIITESFKREVCSSSYDQIYLSIVDKFTRIGIDNRRNCRRSN